MIIRNDFFFFGEGFQFGVEDKNFIINFIIFQSCITILVVLLFSNFGHFLRHTDLLFRSKMFWKTRSVGLYPTDYAMNKKESSRGTSDSRRV